MNFKINSAPAGMFNEVESVVKLELVHLMLEEINRLEQVVKNNVDLGTVSQRRELLLDFAEYSENDKTSEHLDELVDNYLDNIK